MIEDNKQILAFMAHPDDVEFLCAGTLAKLRNRGYEIHIATMTAGDGGSMELPPKEIARLRLSEAACAASFLGASYRCAGAKDFFITYDEQIIKKTIEVIRLVNPFMVITHSPTDYMVDHEMTSRLVRAACFAAPAPNAITGAQPAAPPIAGIPYLYYADPLEGKDIFGCHIDPDFSIDISDVIEIKRKMLECHASQRDWLMKQHGIDHYVLSMLQWGAMRGSQIGVAYAEGFRQHRGHAYPQDNKLAEILRSAAADHKVIAQRGQ